MFFTHSTFIGIDPSAGQRPFVYAALDNELRLLALGNGDMDEVLAFVAGQRQAVAAVCAPQRPNQGLMEQAMVRDLLSPQPRPGRWTNFRVAEYQLRQHHISVPQTGRTPEECPNWMQMGFSLHQRLEKLGYAPYPAENSSHQSMEVYPHGCYTVLLGQAPFSKSSLEGRLQRQLVLHEYKINVPDPMRFFEEITRHRLLHGYLPMDELYTQEELDAMVAAYTAWLAATSPQSVTLLGDPQEGLIVLPISELKPHY